MSNASSSSARRRPPSRSHNAEDQALNQIAKEAEARLAAKRAERAQAREIRLRELDKKQQEDEEKQDKAYTKGISEKAIVSRIGSHRTTDDDDTRDIRIALHELEDKYKKAMMNTAQLDNEKQSLNYQVDLLKDRLYDQQEALVELQRQYRDKNRDYERVKRDNQQLQHNYNLIKEQLNQRDRLIQEQGLVIVGTETGELTLAKSPTHKGPVLQMDAALVTPEAAEILSSCGEGTLDQKLKAFAKEKRQLESELKRVKEDLEEEQTKAQKQHGSPKLPVLNGPEIQISEIQHEASKQIHEYKLKLQKSDQDIATLEGSVTRLETQVKRFQTAAENAEKLEEELKADKRRLQRELRESKNSIEELQNRNSHLQKRMEKLKQERIAALVGQ